MGSDIDESKQRGKHRRAGAASTKSGGLAGQSKTNIAVLLGFCVVLVYLFAFYETLMSLPMASRQLQQHRSSAKYFLRHLGRNFNLARPTEWGTDDATTTTKSMLNSNSTVDSKGKLIKINGLEIPQGKWPVSIKADEADESLWDTIVHPGDQETIMKVPPFWSRPIHNNGLMSRETAMKIGTCIESDERGSFVRGDDCPADQRTIYVGIASYRDFECRSTLESIFLRAAHPERIRVGVVDQIVHDEDVRCDEPTESCDDNPEQALCKYISQVDVYEMDAELSIGPVFARHIGYRLYRGEYYATQSDAHVTYTQDWDKDIISQMEATGNDMAVLSTYLTDVQGSIDENGNSLRNTRPIMCNTVYEGGAQGMHLRHASQPEREPFIHGLPQLQPWWAAGYSFSRGHFVVNVPYDYLQPMIFQGEEMSIGIRGFTIGYDYYAPERSVCFHHYAVGKNAKIRNKVHHFWENDNKYAGTGKKAMKRLLGIVHMNPEDALDTWDHTEQDIYGIGGVRSPEKFYELFGIDGMYSSHNSRNQLTE